VYNARNPLFSHILLAGDNKENGRLEVYEIYNRGLDLEAVDLVVLSACQTNLGELSRGDEVIGLSRALIYAGAPSVVSSLWSVSDESTKVLMESFYTHLRAGMSKAGALRQAQMEMIASEEYAHPYYWAAFGLTGDNGVDSSSPCRLWLSALAVLLVVLAVGGSVGCWWWLVRRPGRVREASETRLDRLLEERQRLRSMPDGPERAKELRKTLEELREIGRRYHRDDRG
jgi:hypothetical protein